MPLNQVFITSKPVSAKVKSIRALKLLLGAVVVFITGSCGALRWHSVEQIPAESVAYIRNGVFVSGSYMQGATIIEIDKVVTNESNNNLHKISVGIHEVSILCAEAEGAFDSSELEGKTKNLVFEAKIQRLYQVRCEPFTHWWIEDLESNAIVAGEKYRE